MSAHLMPPDLISPVVPPATIGMLGGGQLGRYALVAAKLMGYRTVVLDPDPAAPAGAVADEHIVAAYDDPAALTRLIECCDVVTTEFENPPADALDLLAGAVRVAPSPAAVRIAQDRIAEKRFLAANGFPVGAYAVLDRAAAEPRAAEPRAAGLGEAGLGEAGGAVEGAPSVDVLAGIPPDLVDGGAVLKTARLGYDGKGQRRVTGRAELAAAWADLGEVACVVEAVLDLRTEISVIVGRSADGATCTWPVAENSHVDGILDVSVVPATISDELAAEGTAIALRIAELLDYTGVLAVEMFVVAGPDGTDELLVNELAPRPHNSGHWTLDASVTSQYEQQIRVICGVGLGSTAMTSAGAAMVNLLGDLWPADGQPDWSVALADPDAKLHLYGKDAPRPGRKMGHITVWADSTAAAAARAAELRASL